jgi:hypothetical protein
MAVHAWVRTARWYATMQGPESRFPAVFQAHRQESLAKIWPHCCISCMPPSAIVPARGQKITTRGHVGQVPSSLCCYITILANSVLFFSQLRKDKVLSSALESFLDGLTHKLSPCPRSLTDSHSVPYNQSFETSPWKASKYHAPIQSQITPN